MFLHDKWTASDTLKLYTDSASTKGFGAVFGKHWFSGAWPEDMQSLRINILGLYPIVLAVEI